MIELVKESRFQIYLNSEKSWLYVNWTGYQTIGSVQWGCEAILAAMVAHRCYWVLNDNTNVVGIWNGASAWVARDWFPRMSKAGLHGFAWVYSPTRFSQISTDETLSHLQPELVNVQVFPGVAEAETWLRERQESLS